jgi:hypothetical protein
MKTKSKNKTFGLNELIKKSNNLNWALIAGGTTIMVAGTKCLSGPDPHWLWGVPLQILSACLIWLGFPNSLIKSPEKIKKNSSMVSNPKKNKQSAYSWLRFLLIILFSAIGQYWLFFGHLVPGLIFWCIAIFILILNKNKASEIRFRSLNQFDYIAAVILIIIAVLMRFPFVSQNLGGLQIDECDNISDSFSVLEGSFKSPYVTGWGGNESLPFFLVAFF